MTIFVGQDGGNLSLVTHFLRICTKALDPED